MSHFKHSAFAAHKLKETKEQMGKPVIKVKHSVETRWNSTLFKLERLLEFKDPLSVATTNIHNILEIMDATGWTIVIDYAPLKVSNC